MIDETNPNDWLARYEGDPLYAAVLDAGSREEFDEAVATLKAIRGEDAYHRFVREIQGTV